MAYRLPNESVHIFMAELGARVAAESQRPSDRFHLGKLLLQSLKDAPDFVSQIDGATGVSETCSSVLKRSTQCATAFRNFGLTSGDVIFITAPNHLDVVVPFYAALYLGVPIATGDAALKINELRNALKITRPKIVFCQSSKLDVISTALKLENLFSKVVTFDENDITMSLSKFVLTYDSGTSVDNFRPNDFDPEETIATLLPTSGTTSLPKYSASTHKNMALSLPYLWSYFNKFPTPFKILLMLSGLQWISAVLPFIFTALMRVTRLHSSVPTSMELLHYLISNYKPSYVFWSPTFMATLLNNHENISWDLSSFEVIVLAGSAVSEHLVQKVKEISPNTTVLRLYGMSELTGVGFNANTKPNSCGVPVGIHQYRLVDVKSKEDIKQPYVNGELWIKSPCTFKGYYNNQKETELCYAEDGWFKTGDLFYRDEEWSFYFVDRIKMILKYRGSHISPVEVEEVIRQHPKVAEVAVTGIPDEQCGDLVVACVVPKNTKLITADEIKQLVKENLADVKQLRGGVIFLDALPLNANSKVDRSKLKEIALKSPGA